MNEKTYYYWDSGRLVAERTGYNYTRYFYDASGIIGMNRNGTVLFFEKNIFGDIINAYNSDGVIMASFSYDGFGNLLYSGGTLAPYVKFRYRGYYYDDETGFYYLKSRYYDPSICRFISADQPELIPQLAKSLGELNLYSYCANNPIMNTDEYGKSVTSAFVLGCIIAGVVMNCGAQIAYNLINENRWYRGVAGAFLGGAVGGFLSAIGIGPVFAGFAAALANAAANQFEGMIIDKTQFNIEVFLTETFIYSIAYSFANVVSNIVYPIQSSWFKPQTLTSFFTKKIGEKVVYNNLLYGVSSGFGANLFIDNVSNHRRDRYAKKYDWFFNKYHKPNYIIN